MKNHQVLSVCPCNIPYTILTFRTLGQVSWPLTCTTVIDQQSPNCSPHLGSPFLSKISYVFQPGWIFLKQNILTHHTLAQKFAIVAPYPEQKSRNGLASRPRIHDAMTPPSWSFISFHLPSSPAKPNYSLFSVFSCFFASMLFVLPGKPILYNYRMSNLQPDITSSWWQHGVVEWHENIYQKTWLRVLDLPATNYDPEVLILRICKMRNISLTRLLWKYFVKTVTVSLYHHSPVSLPLSQHIACYFIL